MAAELDAELPSRRLTGRVLALVNAGGFAIALFVLHQVFRPLAAGNQYYLVLFLAGVLPLTLLSYRVRWRRGAAAGANDQPRAADSPRWHWPCASIPSCRCLSVRSAGAGSTRSWTGKAS